jgi:hypothetical protein
MKDMPQVVINPFNLEFCLYFVDDLAQVMVLFADKTSRWLVAVLKRGEAYQHKRISSQ